MFQKVVSDTNHILCCVKLHLKYPSQMQTPLNVTYPKYKQDRTTTKDTDQPIRLYLVFQQGKM